MLTGKDMRHICNALSRQFLNDLHINHRHEESEEEEASTSSRPDKPHKHNEVSEDDNTDDEVPNLLSDTDSDSCNEVSDWEASEDEGERSFRSGGR